MTETADTYHLLGCILRFHARNADTGAYSFVEGLIAPGAGAPPNRHPGDDEAFFVLDGEFRFLVGDEEVSASTGDFVKVPPGAVHAFTNVGEKPGKLLIINTPGIIHDRFFSEAGEALPTGTTEFPEAGAPDVARLSAIGRDCGLEFVPPPG